MNNQLVANELIKVAKNLLNSENKKSKLLDVSKLIVPYSFVVTLSYEGRTDNIPDEDNGKVRATYVGVKSKNTFETIWKCTSRRGDHNRTGNMWTFGDVVFDGLIDEISIQGIRTPIKVKGEDLRTGITQIVSLACRSLNDKDVNVRKWDIKFNL